MFLFYRDTLECVEYLLGNPLFSDCMDFCPTRLYQDAEQTIHIYTEWVTGNAAWEMQVRPLFCYVSTLLVLTDNSQFSQKVQLSLGLPFHRTKQILQS